MDIVQSSKSQLRSCVACRQTDTRSTLLRFILRGDELIWDRSKSLFGRGAWLHGGCVRDDLDRQFSRAFRKRVNAGRLVEQVYTESKAESMQTKNE